MEGVGYYDAKRNPSQQKITSESSLYYLLKDQIELISPNSSPRSESVFSDQFHPHYNHPTKRLSQLLSDEAKEEYRNLVSMPQLQYKIPSNVCSKNDTKLEVLYNFDKEDLVLVELFQTLNFNLNIKLSEEDVMFLKQNLHIPAYNFTLLIIAFFVRNQLFKPGYTQKSSLHFGYILNLTNYLSFPSLQISLTYTHKYYLEIAYKLLNYYFNTIE
ncbi:hypothetical protein K502DRAFT_65745 [Neoconidiobolus thromboides FSU 785]|nr:hypothetical protein K502DRAFT_65745 [Neoconidiobolus thromboides FSU 785]